MGQGVRAPDLGQNGVPGSLVDVRILSCASFLPVCEELPGRKTRRPRNCFRPLRPRLQQFRDLSGAEPPHLWVPVLSAWRLFCLEFKTQLVLFWSARGLVSAAPLGVALEALCIFKGMYSFVYARLPRCVWRWTVCGSPFSPPIVWIPGMQPVLLNAAASAFIRGAISPARLGAL